MTTFAGSQKLAQNAKQKKSYIHHLGDLETCM